MASIAAAGPVMASPPAKTPGALVRNVSGSASMLFHLVILIGPRVVFSSPTRSGSWPIAEIAQSQAKRNSEPLTWTGRRRPLASGSPSSIRKHSRPMSRPLSMTARLGATKNWISTPSSRASWTSASSAGISLAVRR